MRPLPLLTDIGIAAALVAAMLVELVLLDGGGSDVTPLAVGLMLLAVAPLFVRHRHPGWALTGCMLMILPLQNVIEIHQTIPFPAMVAGYSLALVAERRRLVLVALVLAPAVLINLAVVSEHPFFSFETLKNLAFVFFPLVIGVAVRDRRAFLEALVERAETAERTREEEARRRVDEERLRIARDLHDMVAHSLVAINVQAGVAAHVQDPETSRRAFRDIKQVSGEALTDLRTTLGVLRAGDTEAPVTPTPSLEQLADLAGVLRGSGVEVTVELADAEDVPGPVGAAAYRIAQEALTNVMRHAGPTRARVSTVRDGAALVLSVDNDAPAPGREPTPGSGHGIQGMRERAAAVGGSLHAGPLPDGGWVVRARLPVAAGTPDAEPVEGVPTDAPAQEPAIR